MSGAIRVEYFFDGLQNSGFRILFFRILGFWACGHLGNAWPSIGQMSVICLQDFANVKTDKTKNYDSYPLWAYADDSRVVCRAFLGHLTTK